MKKHAWVKVAAAGCLAFSLSGCVLAMVGGAGAGGYYVGQDERDASQIADDASITSSINMKYLTTKDVSAVDINVDTYNGVVTLYGSVPNPGAENRAVSIARSTKGVRQVISKLTIVPVR